MIPGSTDPSTLDLLVGLFSEEVLASAVPMQECVSELLPAEYELLRGASHERKAEIATGRIVARRLLDRLGCTPSPLLPDTDRVPIWPDGIVGCISHKDRICAVAVVSSRERVGLGLDIEPDEPTRPGLEDKVAGPGELVWITAKGPSETGRRCRAVFSAKEAVYKAFFPSVREPWAFRDVEIAIDFDNDSFLARLPDGAGQLEIEGRIFRRRGWILTSVELH